MKWSDITLAKYYEIQDILSVEDDYTVLNLIDCLYNVDSQSLPVYKLKEFDISFLKTPIPEVSLKKTYTINGTVYKSNCDLTRVSVAQFIDYQNYSKESPRFENILSIFFLPEGATEYNTGYDINKVKEDLLQLPIDTVRTIAFFFRKTIENILLAFPTLFNQASEETEDGETTEERTYPKPQAGGLMEFGIIPYLLKYCEVTNETITSVMNESVNFVFYIVSYEVLKAKEQEKQLQQIRNKYK